MAALDENDDARHIEQALPLTASDPAVKRAGKAIALFAAGLQMVPCNEWQSVFPNDISAVACFARGFRQLRGAYMLMLWGYYAETRPLLRFAYEACGLARMLAKDPPKAERWLQKKQWFPEKAVRDWFAGSDTNSRGASPDEVRSIYITGYREMSARSHPTALACVSALDADEDGFEPRLATVFVEEEFRACAAEIAATGIFACFALRNAAVDEKAIDPQWREDVYELAREILNSDMPHLDRDWAEERDRYAQLRARVQSAARLEKVLRSDPRSWQNLQEPSESTE
jgi:hypothetical protein